MRRVTHAPPAPPARAATSWLWSEALEGLTPIVRGGSRPKQVDEDRPVRVPSIRGQLRLWWRATQDTADVDVLRAREAQVFGAVHGSLLASRVRVGVRSATSKAVPAPRELGYGLWPLRGVEGKQLHDDVRAHLDVEAPQELEAEVERALDAWLLCGGLGGRSRRGFGALWPESWTPFESPEAWASRIARLAPRPGKRPWPSLAGAVCLTWDGRRDSPMAAVNDALQRFREARGMRALGPREFDGSRRMPQIQEQDWAAVRTGQGTLGWWPALGLPIQVRSSHGHFHGTREIKPQHTSRLPSPILVRPVPIAGVSARKYVGALVVLRLWATPAVQVKGAPQQVRGQVRQEALDAFVDFLVSRGARRLEGER